jgi:hypothetical protein
MRKLFLASVSFIFVGHAYAQFEKGDRMAGASVASFFYNSGSSEVTYPSFQGYDSKSNNWGLMIQPTMGWFISSKTAVGASLNINPSGQKITYSANGTSFQQDESNSFTIGIGGFARHYLGMTGSMYPYAQLGVNAGISNASSEGYKYFSGTPAYKNTYDGKSSGGFFTNASLQLGLTKLLSQDIGLDIFAGYTYSYNKNTYKTTTSTDIGNNGSIDSQAVNEPTTKFTNHNFLVGVGFQVFLKKKK